MTTRTPAEVIEFRTALIADLKQVFDKTPGSEELPAIVDHLIRRDWLKNEAYDELLQDDFFRMTFARAFGDLQVIDTIPVVADVVATEEPTA